MLPFHDIRESRIFQEGFQEGLEEARRELFQQGKLEVQMEVIARLHSLGYAVDKICDLLGVDAETVNKTLAPSPHDS